jgi:hypothetical protein
MPRVLARGGAGGLRHAVRGADGARHAAWRVSPAEFAAFITHGLGLSKEQVMSLPPLRATREIRHSLKRLEPLPAQLERFVTRLRDSNLPPRMPRSRAGQRSELCREDVSPACEDSATWQDIWNFQA